jgi:hypothetical protein
MINNLTINTLPKSRQAKAIAWMITINPQLKDMIDRLDLIVDE